MRIGEVVQGLLETERRWLRPGEYTGVFPLRASPGPELMSALERFAATRELASIPGLLSARWSLLAGTKARLWFAFSCDGNVLDLLEELGGSALPALDAVLAQCEGFPDRGDNARWHAFFRKHRIHNTRPFSSAGSYEVSEERSAVPPLELTEFERALDHEAEVLHASMRCHRARARRDARARHRTRKAPNGLRGVHAKHHGLIKAQFRVCSDVPPELRHGVLNPGAQYEAWVRVSNGDPTSRPDWLPDVRGFAIKLLGIQGAPLFDLKIPDGIAVPEGRTQDFALVTHPTFFIRNARDYLLLRSLLDARPDHPMEWLELLAGFSVFWLRRPRELSILTRTLLRWCRHPLLLEYHSLAAFLLGPKNTVKWSLRPTPATARALVSESLVTRLRGFITAPNHYLKHALQRSLDALNDTPLEFEVAVHVPGEAPLPVEDPTTDWRKLGARRVVVATLIIATQNAISPERLANAQTMVMSPWHSLAAHRPLGSLNRARLGAYLASSQERWRANGVVAPDESKLQFSRRVTLTH
jgi:hypothetical protein